MAARENQGYLIAVIILVLLTLVLALVAFLGIQKAYEQAETAQASDAKLKAALKIARAEGLKSEALKAAIGDLGAAPLEINKAIQDLQSLSTSSDLTDSDKKIVGDILSEVREAKEVYDQQTGGKISNGDDATKVETFVSRITDLTALVDRIRKDYKIEGLRATEAARAAAEDIARAEETLKSTIAEMENLNQKLNEEKAASLVKENTLKEEVEKNKKAIQEVTRKSEEAASQAAAVIQAAKNQIELITVENVTLKKTLNEITTEVFDHADGKVIRVASGLGTVFIDIGRADGLTSNRSFSVYDPVSYTHLTLPTIYSV